MIKHIIILLRPQQWLKNIFVFAPLFFDRHATQWCFIWPCMLVFIAFSLTASGVYCLNDIHDIGTDRLHPVKRNRPVASGAVSILAAYAAMGVAWFSAFLLIALEPADLQKGLYGTLLLYIIMNVAYCVKLKQIALLDVIIIATGFVLRIVAGALAADIILSHWIVLTTFLLALFLAFTKRRDDVAIYEASGIMARKSLERYNMDFLNQTISVLGSITIMCYMLYTVSDDVVQRMGSPFLYVTSLFVLAGILRLMQLTFVNQKSGSPTKILLHDHFVQACVVGWITAFIVILYA